MGGIHYHSGALVLAAETLRTDPNAFVPFYEGRPGPVTRTVSIYGMEYIARFETEPCAIGHRVVRIVLMQIGACPSSTDPYHLEANDLALMGVGTEA
jgi:hypothetical protein